PNMSLTGYSLKMVNGSGGMPILPGVALTGQSLSASGYLVVAQDATVVVAPSSNVMINAAANMQNGPDNVQLLNGVPIFAAGGYGIFAAPDTFVGEAMPAQSANGIPQSVSRLPNGADTGNNATDFAFGALTPGLPNTF